jgi:uncharacterized protein YegJ (DUF2314 family)
MFSRTFLVALLLLLTFAADAKDLVVGVAADDPEMNAAIAHARSEVDRVINALAAGRDVSVKLAVREGSKVEHFWLSNVTYSTATQSFSGKIDNDPETVESVVLGQSVSVHRGEITDWLYIEGGRMHGNYTLRVLLPKLPKAEADTVRRRLSEE